MKDKFRIKHTYDDKVKYFYVKDIDDAIVVINTLTIHQEENEDIEFITFNLEVHNPDTDSWNYFYDENNLSIIDIMELEDDASDISSYQYMLRGE